ncbi:MAG: TATA-box-binding protein, partial [Nanoarchaeota archaeon]|nr:TATA-box-binding protein [Nanoarchaeota archaeon]
MNEFYLKIENVVAFTSLGKDIPLLDVANKLKDAEYSPESFPGVVYRISDPRAATLIFSSGKIVCTGAKSIDKAKIAMHKVVDDIRNLKIKLPTKFDIKIENIVASTQIRAKYNLEEIAFALDNVEYEPEQFPGLVFRISEPRVAFLLFGSGKIICTGARSIKDIHSALAKFKDNMGDIGIKVKAIPPEIKKEEKTKPEKTEQLVTEKAKPIKEKPIEPTIIKPARKPAKAKPELNKKIVKKVKTKTKNV